MAMLAGVVVEPTSTVTLLVNGGQIAYTDVAESLGSGRPVVVLAGSGRTADAIAEARAGNGGDDRAVEIAASPLTTIVDVGKRVRSPSRSRWPSTAAETCARKPAPCARIIRRVGTCR